MPTAHEVFQRRQAQKFEPLLRGVNGSYLFDIEDTGYWFIDVRDGAIHIEEARHDADCTIGCEEQDFIDIVEGRRNLLTAAMQGRVMIDGDITLAQKFHGLVSATLESKRREAA